MHRFVSNRQCTSYNRNSDSDSSHHLKRTCLFSDAENSGNDSDDPSQHVVINSTPSSKKRRAMQDGKHLQVSAAAKDLLRLLPQVVNDIGAVFTERSPSAESYALAVKNVVQVGQTCSYAWNYEDLRPVLVERIRTIRSNATVRVSYHIVL